MGDLLGSLLGGGSTSAQQPQGGAGDLLGSLLGGGGEAQPQGQQNPAGVDVGDLLNAGMAFMNTKSQGGNNMQAAINALVAGSAMGNSDHRAQSGNLVVNALLNAIGSKSRKK